MLTFTTYPNQHKDMDRFIESYPTSVEYIAPATQVKGLKPKRNRSCRFCGRAADLTTFRNKPHIIPRFLGNIHGISDFECDDCNHHFGKLESHFADYLGIARSVLSAGSEKIPKFKSPGETLIASRAKELLNKGALDISNADGQNFHFDPENLTWGISYTKPPHIPINVYKTLLKIALSVLPDNEMHDYKVLIDFLLHDKNAGAFRPFAKIFQLTTAFKTFRPYCIIFKRKDPGVKFPLHMVYFAYENLSYQFFLPYHSSDVLQIDYKDRVDLLFAPPLIFADQHDQEEVNAELLDLSEQTIQRNTNGHITFHTDAAFFKGIYNGETNGFTEQPFSASSITNVILTTDGKPEMIKRE
jgi:hypothetical protein